MKNRYIKRIGIVLGMAVLCCLMCHPVHAKESSEACRFLTDHGFSEDVVKNYPEELITELYEDYAGRTFEVWQSLQGKEGAHQIYGSMLPADDPALSKTLLFLTEDETDPMRITGVDLIFGFAWKTAPAAAREDALTIYWDQGTLAPEKAEDIRIVILSGDGQRTVLNGDSEQVDALSGDVGRNGSVTFPVRIAKPTETSPAPHGYARASFSVAGGIWKEERQTPLRFDSVGAYYTVPNGSSSSAIKEQRFIDVHGMLPGEFVRRRIVPAVLAGAALFALGFWLGGLRHRAKARREAREEPQEHRQGHR